MTPLKHENINDPHKRELKRKYTKIDHKGKMVQVNHNTWILVEEGKDPQAEIEKCLRRVSVPQIIVDRGL
jgi:hypothetical protein